MNQWSDGGGEAPERAGDADSGRPIDSWEEFGAINIDHTEGASDAELAGSGECDYDVAVCFRLPGPVYGHCKNPKVMKIKYIFS